jgi:hypothetical protein
MMLLGVFKYCEPQVLDNKIDSDGFLKETIYQ